MCVFMCLCTCVQMPSRGQKRSSDSLALEFQVVVSCGACWGLVEVRYSALLHLLQSKLLVYQRNFMGRFDTSADGATMNTTEFLLRTTLFLITILRKWGFRRDGSIKYGKLSFFFILLKQNPMWLQLTFIPKVAEDNLEFMLFLLPHPKLLGLQACSHSPTYFTILNLISLSFFLINVLV